MRNDIQKPDYITPNQLAERIEGINISMIRRLLLHRESNGLKKHVRKIGRRVLISERGFYQWLDEQKE